MSEARSISTYLNHLLKYTYRNDRKSTRAAGDHYVFGIDGYLGGVSFNYTREWGEGLSRHLFIQAVTLTNLPLHPTG